MQSISPATKENSDGLFCPFLDDDSNECVESCSPKKDHRARADGTTTSRQYIPPEVRVTMPIEQMGRRFSIVVQCRRASMFIEI